MSRLIDAELIEKEEGWLDGTCLVIPKQIIYDAPTVDAVPKSDIEMLIAALEKQKKYKWHDLRENPEDLPKPYDDIVFVVMKSKKHLIGWMNDDDEFDTEDLEMCLDKDVIIAWRYTKLF